MSFQVGAICYPSALAAAQATASAEVGTIISHDSSAYVVGVSGISETSISYTLTPVVSGSSLTLTTQYDAQPCQLMTPADAVELGWMIAGVWLAVYAVIWLKNSLIGGSDNDRNYA